MYARVHTSSTISTQESSEADNEPVRISKSIYSLNSRANIDYVSIWGIILKSHLNFFFPLKSRVAILYVRGNAKLCHVISYSKQLNIHVFKFIYFMQKIASESEQVTLLMATWLQQLVATRVKHGQARHLIQTHTKTSLGMIQIFAVP